MQAQDDALLVERRPRRLAGRARHNPDDRLFGGREMVSIADVPTLDWPIALYANLAGDVQPKLAKGGRCAQPRFGKVPSRGGPRFVEMAMMAERQRPNGGDVLGALLGSACCTMDRGCEMLRPLWAEEAMHRAYNFLRLVGARKTAIVGEDVFARDLAAQFRELEIPPDREVVPCSDILSSVVTNFGTLFCGPANIVSKAQIDDVSLPAYRRRALVLAASELISNALLHAFQGRRAGRIAVSLNLHGPGTASLYVADDGVGFVAAQPNYHCGIAAGLAELLETDLAYERLDGWTIAKIVFPVHGL